MNETTINLEMPYILPSQAQKHVTHNEALQRLDATVQLVLSAITATPPQAPAEGACFAIAAAASGAWAGREGRIAMWQDGVWSYIAPRTGWHAWNGETGQFIVYRDNEWRPLALPANAACETLGVSTTADTTNRLALSSPASLFTHAGGGHQIKVNKAAAGDTASLLFQTGWTGYAEMGLAGNNEFSVKVSDGANWRSALSISQQGHVSRPLNPAVTAWRNVATSTPANGSQTGFDQIRNSQGNAALGAALAEGAALVVPASGLYLLCLRLCVLSTTGFEVGLVLNGASPLARCKGGNSGAIASTVTTTALASLAAGDTLSLTHTGSVTLEHGETRTALSAILL